MKSTSNKSKSADEGVCLMSKIVEPKGSTYVKFNGIKK